MQTPKILAFGTSLRSASLNKSLALIAGETARRSGAEVTHLDLAEYPMPIYNNDDEVAHGLPEHAVRFKRQLQAHDALIIASAEYNSSMTAAVKNAIDWASRVESPDEAPLSAFTGKTAILLSASPGGLGGMRALVPLRMLLENIGVLVLPGQLSLSGASVETFGDGVLADARRQATLETLIGKLVETIRRLKSHLQV